MRSGSYIQALGRQCFQPSQPIAADDSDYSQSSNQSNERQRQLIKAQNDVLATVGVCLRETKKEQEQSESTTAENKAGLFLGAVDLTITYLAGWPLIGIRNRLQTYREYEHLRYREVLKLAWQRNTLGGLFSGMPAHLCYQMLNLTEDYCHATFLNWLELEPLFLDPVANKHKNGLLLYSIHHLISFTSWFLVYPLWRHSNLQVLHLVPASQLLPPLASFIPFTSSSPISAPQFPHGFFSPHTPLDLLSQAVASDFLFSFFTQTLFTATQYYLYHQIIQFLPAPTANPGITTITSLPLDASLEITGAGAPITIPLEGVPEHVATDPWGMSPVAPTPVAPVGGLGGLGGSEGLGSSATPATPATSNHRRQRHQYRNTTLSTHPVDVAASHAADCVSNAVLMGVESMGLRRLARGVVGDELVYHTIGTGGVIAALAGFVGVYKALVVGEWGLMWALFEATWGVSTYVGVRWFGYGR
ncbi:Similar to hypothetical protein AOL_s00076g151 [Arthrobotrys oligospora ATCC 24927]; acc. no. EGX50387 [Pyronema omphalodes CBS 100304]|uniref:Uncharacterized protein n=1 Tax=Pyronema omphalodes (strain CBS 100304) TaxID=1076935 RepID=U4LN62_PYROM|nr:Similar to hypothetical protein AOL_s00076g151 [Arthrobotrys oligospora ATCC 24927]; acc. no. EGX50387 [Pyronema omphalodes CBS 100304]